MVRKSPHRAFCRRRAGMWVCKQGVSLKLESVTTISYYCPQTPPSIFQTLQTQNSASQSQPGPGCVFRPSQAALAACLWLALMLVTDRRASHFQPRLLWFPTVLTPYGSSQEAHVVCVHLTCLKSNISEILLDQTRHSRCVLTYYTVFLDNVCVI